MDQPYPVSSWRKRPATARVYSRPAPLQMPLFNVVLCFWSLPFAHITGRQNGRAFLQ